MAEPPAARLAALAAELAKVAAELAAQPAGAESQPQREVGRWLSADEVAALLGVTRRKAYSLARQEAWKLFTIRLGRETRFQEIGLLEWLARQRAEQDEE